MAEGRAVSVCSFTRLHPYLSKLVDYFMMDVRESTSGFRMFPDGMVARNITFMQETFSRILVKDLHPTLATKHPNLYTMVAKVDIPYNHKDPVCFLYVGELFILEDHEKFANRHELHPCDFIHKKRRCQIVPNQAEFLDRTSKESYPHPAEFLHNRDLDRCHFMFKSYGILYQILGAIAGEEIFVYYGDDYEQSDPKKEDYFVFEPYYNPPRTGLQFIAAVECEVVASCGADGSGAASSVAASVTAGDGTEGAVVACRTGSGGASGGGASSSVVAYTGVGGGGAAASSVAGVETASDGTEGAIAAGGLASVGAGGGGAANSSVVASTASGGDKGDLVGILHRPLPLLSVQTQRRRGDCHGSVIEKKPLRLIWETG